MTKPVLLIFDFDGTIADNRVIAHEVLNEVLVHYGYDPVSFKRSEQLRDMSITELMKSLNFPLWRGPALFRFIRKAVVAKAHRLEPVDGMPELIRELARVDGYQLALVSSNAEKTVKELLGKFGILDCFVSVHGYAKPLSKYAVIRRITRRYGKGATVIGIGDEPRDADGAKIASVASIAVDWGLTSTRRLKRSRADTVVSSPKELAGAIKAMVT